MIKYNRDQAIQYCLKKINKRELEANEYNILRQYKARYRQGKLGEKGIRTLFKRFNVDQHCYFTIDK